MGFVVREPGQSEKVENRAAVETEADLLSRCSLHYNFYRVARCPVFNRTVRYFGSLSGIKMTIIPDNACVNSLIFCDTDIGTSSVRYFGKCYLEPQCVVLPLWNFPQLKTRKNMLLPRNSFLKYENVIFPWKYWSNDYTNPKY